MRNLPFAKNKNLLLTLIILSGVYLLFSHIVSTGIVNYTTAYAYYDYLIDALADFRLHVNSPNVFDLSQYKNRWYLYWGPAPVIAISLISSITTIKSDIFYTLAVGIVNFWLFYLLIAEWTKHVKKPLSPRLQTVLLINFAIASPNFYLSLRGTVWHTSQIFGIFYLLFFFIFLFKSINQHFNLKFFLISVIFFNLAVLSRYLLISYVLFFGYYFFVLNKSHPVNLSNRVFLQLRIKSIFPWLAVFLTITSLSALIFFGYNYARFDNILETGVKHQVGNPRYHPFTSSGKLLHPSFLTHNIKHYFFNPFLLRTKKPHIVIDPEGHGIFSVYPILLSFLFLPFFTHKGKLNQHARNLAVTTGLIFATNMTILLFYFATGATQFGSRYFFDAIPAVFLALALVADRLPFSIIVLLTVYGIIVNLTGATGFWFLHFL